MQPIIPLQPYIREGEGSGSAYELPIQTESILKPLLNEVAIRRKENQLAQKEVNDELAKISSMKGDLLPEHQTQFVQKQKELFDWFAKQRAEGRKVYNPNDPSYIEGKKKIAELTGLAQSGKTAKDRYVKLYELYNANPDKYEQSSLAEGLKSISQTPLEKVNSAQMPSLSTTFDPNEYRSDVLNKIQPTKEVDLKNIKKLPGGQYAIISKEYHDPKSVVANVMSDSSPKGQRYKQAQLERFASLPQAEQEAIYRNIAKVNTSASPIKPDGKPNPNYNTEAARNALTEYMVGESFGGYLKDNVDVKTYGEKSNMNIGFGGGGYVSPNKWVVTPVSSQTEDVEFNKINKALQQSGYGSMSKDQFYERYPQFKNSGKYDELILENMDIPENKTFEFQTKSGKNVNVVPISIRKLKGSDDWYLMGKQIIDSKHKKDISLPLDGSVKGKLRAIIAEDPDVLINEFFPQLQKKQNKNVSSQNKKVIKGF